MLFVGRRLGLLVLVVCMLAAVFLPDVVQVDAAAAGCFIRPGLTETCFNFISAEAALVFVQGNDVQEGSQIRAAPVSGTMPLFYGEIPQVLFVLSELLLCAAAAALIVVVYVHKKDGRKRGCLLLEYY